MTILYINTGSSANKGDGDTLRTAFNKINSTFEYIDTVTNYILAGGVLAIQSGEGIAVNTETGIVTISATNTFYGGAIPLPLIMSTTTQSVSTSTGALQVAGGVGVGGNLYASELYDNGVRVLTTATLPAYPIIPTNVSAFANDTGYLTTATLPAYPTIPTNVSAFANDAGYLTATDISSITTATNVSAFANDAGYLTATDVSSFITIGDIPTNVSAFANDTGYLTSATLNQYVNTTIIQADTAPSTANSSTVWYDTIGGRSYVYISGSWVDASPASDYILASASTSTLGGVKVDGSTIAIDVNGVISSIPEINLLAVAQDIIPATDKQYNLGSPTRQWKSLYVSTNTIYIDNVPLSIDTGTNKLQIGSATTTTSANIATEDFVMSQPVLPSNINLDGGGASTVYEATSLLFADGGFASTRRTVTDPLFDAGANGASKVYGTNDNLINGGGA